MKTYIGARKLTVDGFWNEDESGASVLLSAVDRKDAADGKLRTLLFAWHKASWYGADIEEISIGERKLLKIPPLLAMDYLSSPQHVRLLQVDWTDRLGVLMQMAEHIRTALLNGWFAPDWERWNDEKRAWRMSIPEKEHAFSLQWDTNAQAAHRNGDIGIEHWISGAIEQMIEENEQAGSAWKAVSSASGEAVLRRKAADEEDWLIAIGLRKDVLPFRIALQLVEPAESAYWRLRPALQDRDGGPWLPIRFNEKDGGWEADTEDEREIPSEWLSLLVGKLAKEQLKWITALPELKAASNENELRERLSDNEAWNFLEHASVQLLEAGCPVLLPSWWEAVRTRKLRLKAKMKSSVGSAAQPMFGLDQIVQFDWKLALGDVNLSEAEFMQLAEQNRRLFHIGGEWVHLDPQDVTQIKQWLKRMGKRKGLSFRDVLEMHLRGGIPLDDSGELESELEAEVELNEHMTAWLTQLQQISEIPSAEIPPSFLGELRPYQHQGVSWLLFLRKFGLGGVLADDMGLGKTIQFMAYLVYIKERKLQSNGPSLLICPTSVIGNWEKELEKFAPSLRVMLHYGNKREKGEHFRDSVAEADLVITSYSLAQLDEEDLNLVDWDALCLDEAQNIKNVYTKQSTAIRRLPAQHRIALTGTPMENRLTELWSIYDFINPGYLGNINEFRKEVVAPIEKTRDEKMIAGLQRWVKPFMLRRVKKDPNIQLSLPDKNEFKTYMTLTAEQGVLYENLVADLLENLDKLGPMQRRGLILAALTKLKQLCDHPSLLSGEDKPAAWEIERSNKVARLLEMCEEIAAEGERCLIFTQYIDMGHQLKQMLEEKLGLPVPYLHGGVPKVKRDQMIEQFQNADEPCCAFVLSLKAGGTGLNLTAANHVFHFDRWWNPAVENQATDRAFRIGQTKQVQVHKFITLGTLEEKIDEMIERKQSLNDQVVGQSEQWITEMTTEDLRELFALRKGWLKG
ncbi:SNF2 family DNA or RNA helicase [Paenibacillus endophyticus]|uniref:SNF2 family DNA or RNA helicase n=1 Tax=Paenibacillus endophyticus TaxID=1294268 RepID=A0A7W5GCK2_9BACL|nr:DEAD/DEAH box helicase [Paenibacillus endophyticus]MBB3154946.1 SNF2 family DNA or RNA helicase [Paenibacillus endophyticus]